MGDSVGTQRDTGGDCPPVERGDLRTFGGPVQPGGKRDRLGVMVRAADILAAAVEGVRALDERLRDEQAVHGVDALDEVGLHPVIAGGLLEAGFGVEREVVYPGEHAVAVRRSKRARCDLVVLPEIGMRLEDPAREQAVLNAGEGTLFAGVSHAMDDEVARVPAGDAYWVEVKAVAQHAFVDGVPVANRSYASQLVRGAMGDLVKLASDASIWAGAAVMVLFCEGEGIARHDLGVLGHELLNREAPMGSPEIGGVAIEDRAGNAWCGIGVYPVRVG